MVIIEAGHDLRTLLFRGRFGVGSLRMALLGSDLRFLRTIEVLARFDGVFGHEAVDALVAAIPETDDLQRFGYAAVGFDVPDVWPYPAALEIEPLLALERRLMERGVGFLGVQLYDDEAWVSTGPMHSFEDYPSHATLPRVLVVPGPHPFGSCRCQACLRR